MKRKTRVSLLILLGCFGSSSLLSPQHPYILQYLRMLFLNKENGEEISPLS